MLGLGLTLFYTAKATWAASAATKAAEDTLRHSRDMAQIELRAYVSIDNPTLSRDEASDTKTVVGFESLVTYKNYGSIPAEDFRYRMNAFVQKSPPPIKRISRLKWVEVGAIAQSDWFAAPHLFTVDPETHVLIDSNDTMLYLLCEYTYRDVFGHEYVGQLTLVSDRSLQWGSCTPYRHEQQETANQPCLL